MSNSTRPFCRTDRCLREWHRRWYGVRFRCFNLMNNWRSLCHQKRFRILYERSMFFTGLIFWSERFSNSLFFNVFTENPWLCVVNQPFICLICVFGFYLPLICVKIENLYSITLPFLLLSLLLTLSPSVPPFVSLLFLFFPTFILSSH